jgi:hypothetical protein
MVLEIRLVLQLIKEIHEVLGMNAELVQGCIVSLRRMGLCAMVAQAWVFDPKEELALLDVYLKGIQEVIPEWRVKINELIGMV